MGGPEDKDEAASETLGKTKRAIAEAVDRPDLRSGADEDAGDAQAAAAAAREAEEKGGEDR